MNALAGVIVMWFIAMRRTKGGADIGEDDGDARGRMFGRGYVVIVVLEVAALFGGIQALRLLGWPTVAGVAWTALIVGMPFVSGVLSGMVLLSG
ncbi:hypothetical protein FXF51_00725 [Nonomuraea sp. PA05]|uniref:hypothetical protein n=1 Tax=Nonomuraea sp. PA05 TaxID=2604466 RepID=UPI0011D7335B|nr:hypothetical protein [Nonomuraea sp. PA05]TYB70999.1 hypothetical protein FXF51_00725 [Nonomuraea sp. PA05]